MSINRPGPLAYILMVASLFSGCTHLPASRTNWSRTPATPAWANTNFTRSAAGAFTVHEHELETRRVYTVKLVALEASSNGSEIVVEYYQRPSGTNAVVLLLPMSGGGYELERYFARYFVRRGISVALVHRTKVADAPMELSAIDVWLKKRMAELRQVIDWVGTRPELDAGRIGVFGISMGGIQGALLTALDERVQAAVLGLAGGDLPYILTHSTEKGIVRRREAFLRERQLTNRQLEDDLRRSVALDPLALAPGIDPQSTLLVLGVFDTTVPFRKGWELRKKMGRPETILLPTGHYSALLCIPYIKCQALKFFQSRFGAQR